MRIVNDQLNDKGGNIIELSEKGSLLFAKLLYLFVNCHR